MVAKGQLYNRSETDRTLHNCQLASNNVKVRIDTAVEANTLLPVPLNDEIFSISHALGTFVAWPANLVIVTAAPVCN